MAAVILISGHTVVKTNTIAIGETDDGNDIRIKIKYGNFHNFRGLNDNANIEPTARPFFKLIQRQLLQLTIERPSYKSILQQALTILAGSEKQ